MIRVVLAALAIAAPWAWPVAWWAELPAHFIVWTRVAVVLFAVLGVLFGRRVEAGAMLALLVASWRPGAPTGVPAGDGPAWTVASFNVLTSNGDHGAVTGWLAQRPADLVGLIEVDDRWMAAIAASPGPYRVAAAVPRRDNFGMAVLVARDVPWPVTVEDVPLPAGFGDVPSLVARIGGGVPSAVRWVHVMPPVGSWGTHARQDGLDAIARWARAETGPVVVAGDLNTTPWAPSYQGFVRDAGLRAAPWTAVPRGTWPAWVPTPLALPLDHVLAGGGAVVNSLHVGDGMGSDHRVVVAEIR